MLPKSNQTADDKNSQEVHKSAKNKGVTTSGSKGDSALSKPSKVPSDDSTGTANVTSNNKLSNKPADLASVVKAWPELPDSIRSAILAIVRASATGEEG